MTILSLVCGDRNHVTHFVLHLIKQVFSVWRAIFPTHLCRKTEVLLEALLLLKGF